MKEKIHNRSRGCRPETEAKYRPALDLYANTGRSCVEICRQCGVSVKGFSRYIGTYHRRLMLARNGIKCTPEKACDIRMSQRRGQRPETHAKYKDAIAACDSMDYIENNISQIARKFGLNGTNLSRQLRIHYPDILEFRERTRQRLGITTGCHVAHASGARNNMPMRWSCCAPTATSPCRMLPSIAGSHTRDWSST